MSLSTNSPSSFVREGIIKPRLSQVYVEIARSPLVAHLCQSAKKSHKGNAFAKLSTTPSKMSSGKRKNEDALLSSSKKLKLSDMGNVDLLKVDAPCHQCRKRKPLKAVLDVMVTAVVLSVAKRVLLTSSLSEPRLSSRQDSRPDSTTPVINKAYNSPQINEVNKVKRQRKKLRAPEPVWVPFLTECSREAVEDRLRLREFTLRFNPILNIGVRNLEELDDPSSLHDSSTKAILLALLDIIGVEEEAHVKHVHISPQEIQMKLKAIQGLGLNWSKIIPMLEDLQALVPQEHPFHSLPKVEKRDSSYNIRGGRTQYIDAIGLLPMLLHLINVVCNGGSIRQELEVGEEQGRKARSDYHAAVKNASDGWNEQKQVFLDAKPDIQNKGESKADEWSMQYREAEKRYKEKIRDLQSYFRVEINSCASRFEPLGVDTDGRIYYLPSSLGPFRGKKDRPPSDKERLGFRKWGWFIAVYGKPGTQIQDFECDYSDDVNTNVKLREEGWWGFADVSEIRKLSKWLLSRAEAEDEEVAPMTVGKISPAPRSRLNRMKSLAKAISEFADFIDWRLQRSTSK